MVIYEAARAIINIKNVTARQIAPAITVLHLFLGSPRPVLRFAAVRTLNKVSLTHPISLKVCLLDLESLITDSNRSVATLAITTLLKTGNEASVDRLMKQISSFMHEISDEFKIVVVEAIRSLCIKFPQKYPLLINFLSNALRDSGEEPYKRAIVNSIAVVVSNVPEAKEAGLAHLCEYIEDCEYNDLLTSVLHMLGDMGPSTSQPNKYIRYIYNRVILETSCVRAAAVDALCKFALQIESLRPSILVLLRRFLFDGDDEVRDRVVHSLSVLETNQKTMVLDTTPLNAASMEKALLEYLAAPPTAAFDLKAVPIDTGVTTKPTEDMFAVADDTPAVPKVDPRIETEARLKAVPQLSSLGTLFKSSEPVSLTEAETEYTVKCVKHIIGQHVVFEFRIVNTLNDQRLQNVKVVMEGGEQEVDPDELVVVEAAEAVYDQPTFAYVAFPANPFIASQVFQAKLDYTVRDCDPETGECDEGGYSDTYALEDVTLNLSDFMLPRPQLVFATAWEGLANKAENEDTFALTSMETIAKAVDSVVKFLGMAVCESSGKVPDDKTQHTLLLSGNYYGNVPVLVKARFNVDRGVNMELCVRSASQELSQLIIQAVG